MEKDRRTEWHEFRTTKQIVIKYSWWHSSVDCFHSLFLLHVFLVCFFSLSSTSTVTIFITNPQALCSKWRKKKTGFFSLLILLFFFLLFSVQQHLMLEVKYTDYFSSFFFLFFKLEMLREHFEKGKKKYHEKWEQTHLLRVAKKWCDERDGHRGKKE